MTRAELRARMPRLLDEIERRITSPENARRQALWDARGLPRVGNGKIPVTVSPEIQLWARVLDVSLVDYYQVPEVFIDTQLRSRLFAFDTFADDRPLDRAIWMWLGTPFEGTLFGLPCMFLETFEPDDGGAILYADSREALDALAPPDFYRSGLMPLAHRMYEECRALLPAQYDIAFPDFIQTPFAVAAHLLGIDGFLVQCLDDPDGSRQLLERVLECRVAYRQARAAFLGIGLQPGIFDNDVVCTPMISPELYAETIWPVEAALARREGGIDYWHSCGNTTAMLDDVARLPIEGFQHVSAWTDRLAAAGRIARGRAVQACVHPLREVLLATDDQIASSLEDIVHALGHHRLKIDADCLQLAMPLPELLPRICRWIDIAQRLTGGPTA